MAKAQEMVQLAEKFRGTLAGKGGAEAQEGETLDADMQRQLLEIGIASPVTREVAGALYHQQLSRQVRLQCLRAGLIASSTVVLCKGNKSSLASTSLCILRVCQVAVEKYAQPGLRGRHQALWKGPWSLATHGSVWGGAAGGLPGAPHAEGGRPGDPSRRVLPLQPRARHRADLPRRPAPRRRPLPRHRRRHAPAHFCQRGAGGAVQHARRQRGALPLCWSASVSTDAQPDSLPGEHLLTAAASAAVSVASSLSCCLDSSRSRSSLT